MSGSKMAYVPQIGGLDELLALIADDHAYKAHLQAMKDLRDVIVGLLGDLDTHRKVEMALRAAEKAEAASEELLGAAEAKAAAYTAEAAEVLAEVKEQIISVSKEKQDLKKRETFCAETQSTLTREKAAFEKEKQAVKEAQLEENQRLLTWTGTLQERQDDLQRKVEAVNLALEA